MPSWLWSLLELSSVEQNEGHEIQNYVKWWYGHQMETKLRHHRHFQRQSQH